MAFKSEYGQLYPYLGSKRKYVEDTLWHFFPGEGIESYVEPFLGSGSVFAFLAKRGYFANRPAYLSDGDFLIAGLFSALTTDVPAVLTEVLNLRLSWDSKTQRRVLDELFEARDSLSDASSPKIAAQFYMVRSLAVMNRITVTSVGKGFRASFKGNMKPTSDTIPGRLLYMADLLAKVRLTGGVTVTQAFIKDLTPSKNTFAFLDPPYVTDVKSAYYIEDLAANLQEDTAAFAKETVKLDGAYVACNSTSLATELYGDLADSVDILVRRGNGSVVTEKLLVNYAGVSKTHRDYVVPVLDGTFGEVVDPGWKFFEEVAPLTALQRSELYGFTPEQEARWGPLFADEVDRRRAVVSLQLGPNSQRL